MARPLVDEPKLIMAKPCLIQQEFEHEKLAELKEYVF
jgi:hypothetical protein